MKWLALVLLLGATRTAAAGSCLFSGTTTIAFPSYNPLNTTDTYGQGAFTLRCTVGVAAQVGIDGGGAGAANTNTRRMTKIGGGATNLYYQLYSDVLRTLVWNNTTVFEGDPLVDTAIAVYGTISASQDVETGDYKDTVTVTVNF